MGHPYWPLFDLRLSAERVEIRLATDDDLVALARLASKGVHDPDTMPFLFPWTDAPSPELERGMLQWGWRHRADWDPTNWSFGGAVLVDDVIVGVQSLMAANFAIQRTVKSGSWLGRDYQGLGIGTEMRSVMLDFAFNDLGALRAESGGFTDNDASLAVSRKLGYEETYRYFVDRRGVPSEIIDVALTRSTWENAPRPNVTITGLDGCRELFGASA